MLFKLPPARILVVLIVATYVVYLGVNSQLTLYIHPRYVVFTFVMSAIGLCIALLDGYFEDSKNTAKHTHEKKSQVFYIPMYFMILAALFLPARSLTSATISQRSADTGSIITTVESKPAASLFSGSSKGLSIGDWSRIIQENSDPSYYTNKPAKISGFIYEGSYGEDIILLARFVVTCCAVDAVPITVPVDLADWASKYSEDEWIEVEGYFKERATSLDNILVLIPASVEIIEQPSSPYAN